MQVGQGAGPCKIRRAYCSFETSTMGRRLSHAGGAVSGLATSSAVALVLPRLSFATHVERPCVSLILSSRMQNHHLLCFRGVFFHGTFLHTRRVSLRSWSLTGFAHGQTVSLVLVSWRCTRSYALFFSMSCPGLRTGSLLFLMLLTKVLGMLSGPYFRNTCFSTSLSRCEVSFTAFLKERVM